jgi:hypothetical protein
MRRDRDFRGTSSGMPAKVEKGGSRLVELAHAYRRQARNRGSASWLAQSFARLVEDDGAEARRAEHVERLRKQARRVRVTSSGSVRR